VATVDPPRTEGVIPFEYFCVATRFEKHSRRSFLEIFN
jgi:hypothetical protein